MTGSSGGSIALTPIGPLLFRGADDRGIVAFDAVVENRPDHFVAVTDSGFPAVYERIPLFATLRAQLAWLLGMALAFLYAAVCGESPLSCIEYVSRAGIPGGGPRG